MPIIFSNLNYNCSIFWDLRNLQEQVRKAFCYQTLFWPFNVWLNCTSDLKDFENSRPSVSNFKSFSRSLEQYHSHSIVQNNFGHKIPILVVCVFKNILASLCQPFDQEFPTSEDDRVATLDYTLLVKNFTALLEDFQVSQKRVKMRPIIKFFLFHFP